MTASFCEAVFFLQAGGLGVGPRLRASKAPVLPLDDPPMQAL